MRRLKCSLATAVVVAFAGGCGTRNAAPQATRAEHGPSSVGSAVDGLANAASIDDASAMPPAVTRDAAPADNSDRGPSPRTTPDVTPSRPQRAIQSGTLTAGSFDDHERLPDYRRFLAEVGQADRGNVFPELRLGRPVVIHVQDAAGVPLGNARVVVRREGQQRVLLDSRTASDGRALLLAEDRDQPYELTLYPPDGDSPHRARFRSDGQPWHVKLPGTQARLPAALDLALVVDTTGSMSDELEYLKVEIDGIAADIRRMFPQVEQRYALVVYRDAGDAYVTRSYDFTSSLSHFRQCLAAQSAGGGGDYPEAMHLALNQAEQLAWSKQDTARVMFLLGDAPPHDRDAAAALEAVSGLSGRGVRIYPVAASGAALKAEFVLRASAFLSMGRYLFLTDHSGVGNPHADPHVPDYQVERLKGLMIRMIASELAARRLPASEIIAWEGPAAPRPQPQSQSQVVAAPVQNVAQETPPLPWPVPGWMIIAAAIIGVCLIDCCSRWRAA